MSDPVLDMLQAPATVRPAWYDDLFCGDVHLASYWYNRQCPASPFLPVPIRAVQLTLPLASGL